MMYCEDLMEVERALLDALENTASWNISGDFLKLFSSDGVTLARFVVSEEQ